jgi:hypothetical protein
MIRDDFRESRGVASPRQAPEAPQIDASLRAIDPCAHGSS